MKRSKLIIGAVCSVALIAGAGYALNINNSPSVANATVSIPKEPEQKQEVKKSNFYFKLGKFL